MFFSCLCLLVPDLDLEDDWKQTHRLHFQPPAAGFLDRKHPVLWKLPCFHAIIYTGMLNPPLNRSLLKARQEAFPPGLMGKWLKAEMLKDVGRGFVRVAASD